MKSPAKAGFFFGAPGMARCAKRNQLGCGGHAGDLEVKVLYTPGKGKCSPEARVSRLGASQTPLHPLAPMEAAQPGRVT